MLKPENAARAKELEAKMNNEISEGRLAAAGRKFKNLSSVVPGLSQGMLNSYTTAHHLALHDVPEVQELFEELYGPDFRLLHNRMSIRFPNKKRVSLDDLGLHKEGEPGELGVHLLPTGAPLLCHDAQGARPACGTVREHQVPQGPPE